MNLYQRIERLGDMIKLAGLNGSLELIKPKGVDSIPKPPDLNDFIDNVLKTPKVPKTKDVNPNLKSNFGTKQPKFTSELKENSPYNER